MHDYRNHALLVTGSHADLRPKLKPSRSPCLLNSLLGLYEVLTAMYPDRPKGFIHSDLFRDNTLFEGDQLKGILIFMS